MQRPGDIGRRHGNDKGLSLGIGQPKAKLLLRSEEIMFLPPPVQFFLHLRYPGILCTSGNVAHPFSPDTMPAGAAYEFNVYHLLPVDDPCELFPIEMRQVG